MEVNPGMTGEQESRQRSPKCSTCYLTNFMEARTWRRRPKPNPVLDSIGIQHSWYSNLYSEIVHRFEKQDACRMNLDRKHWIGFVDKWVAASCTAIVQKQINVNFKKQPPIKNTLLLLLVSLQETGGKDWKWPTEQSAERDICEIGLAPFKALYSLGNYCGQRQAHAKDRRLVHCSYTLKPSHWGVHKSLRSSSAHDSWCSAMCAVCFHKCKCCCYVRFGFDPAKVLHKTLTSGEQSAPNKLQTVPTKQGQIMPNSGITSLSGGREGSAFLPTPTNQEHQYVIATQKPLQQKKLNNQLWGKCEGCV